MDLRGAVLRGGMYLVGRHIAGLLLSVVGAVLITLLIGPDNFGLYSGALVIVMFLGSVGRLGVDVYLVRHKDDPDPRMYDQAFTVMLLAGGGLAALGLLASPWLGLVVRPDFVPPLRALLPTIPLTLVASPALATLERRLDYRAVSLLDLSGQVSYYVVAVALAALGRGYWAQVAGYWCWQAVVAALTYRVSGYRPRLVWSRPLLREMLGYGLGYSASLWVWQLRTLVPTIVVGRYLGGAGVGYVALAVQAAEVLAFVKNATWRMSIVVLARVQGDHARLRAALEEAMLLQVLALGPLLDGFALASPLVPLILGRRWAGVPTIYPFIALGYLANVVFNMHSSVLYVLRRNRDVTLFNAANTVLLAGAGLLLVPRLGLAGYGLGEAAALASYAVLHVALARVMPFSYRRALPWLMGCAPPLFGVFLPLGWRPFLWLPLVAVVFWPRQRRQIAEYLGHYRLRFMKGTDS